LNERFANFFAVEVVYKASNSPITLADLMGDEGKDIRIKSIPTLKKKKEKEKERRKRKKKKEKEKQKKKKLSKNKKKN